ncbi:oxidoreductase [Rhodococcoides trifolii]|uniref:Oxidoreductase n=1 Tax=Rhodococcoides trifolii TaxID=908250 RepID=A0A917CYZ8_9NOCA|nr:SDR family oxidoreductase [Rhodococcus trifolii]GGG03217.1 oxidoreductase [Rhodococcus trifolii]
MTRQTQFDVDGNVVIVGGASGIGLAVAHLAAHTAKTVSILDLHEERPESLASLPDASYSSADVLDDRRLADCFATIAERGPIDRVFVSAGITLPKTIAEVSASDAQRCLMINLMGSINTLSALLPHLSSDASVVLTASVAAHTGGGFVGGSVYGASKAGVVGLTRGAARELAPRGVRVNCVAPGATYTGMVGDDPAVVDRLTSGTLLGRLASPDDIANGVLYLWSPAGSYLTGTTLNINGGSHLG